MNPGAMTEPGFLLYTAFVFVAGGSLAAALVLYLSDRIFRR